MTDKQKLEWEKYTKECWSRGVCEFSGLDLEECVVFPCDCGESPEGAKALKKRWVRE